MNKNSKTPLATRHIMIVIAGILICLGPCALVYNTWSIFVVPVSSSLGASSSQFTLYITLVYLIGALFSPIAGNLMERFDLRLVLQLRYLLSLSDLVFVHFGLKSGIFIFPGYLLASVSFR